MVDRDKNRYQKTINKSSGQRVWALSLAKLGLIKDNVTPIREELEIKNVKTDGDNLWQIETDIEDKIVSKVTVGDRVNKAIDKAIDLIKLDQRCWHHVTNMLEETLVNLVGPGACHDDKGWKNKNLPALMKDFKKQVDMIVRH